MKWYVVQVLTQHEKKAKRALEENQESHGVGGHISKVVLPTENVSEVKHGKQRVVEKRVWPGYLLINMEMTDEAWAFVKGTDSVVGFLGGEHPTELSEEEIQRLLSDLEDKKSRVVQRHQFEIGDKVKITEGVFVNFVGTVVEVFPDKGRISVMVSIFGRDTRVDDLEFWQVEEYTDDTAST